MKTAKIFTNGRSQAVRLPREYRFNTKFVNIQKIGDKVILTPVKKSIDGFISSLNAFSEDFMNDRLEPLCDKRESI